MPNHEVKPRDSGLYSQSTKSWKGPIVKSYFSSLYLLKLNINHLQNSVLYIFTHSFLLPMSLKNCVFALIPLHFDLFLHFQCVSLHLLLTTCTGLPSITALWHCWAWLYSNPLFSENSGSGFFSSTLSLSPPVAFSFSSQNMAPSRTLGYTFFRSSVQEKEFWTRRGASRQGPRPGATALALLPQLGRVRDPGPQSPRFLLPDSPPDSASARTRPRRVACADRHPGRPRTSGPPHTYSLTGSGGDVGGVDKSRRIRKADPQHGRWGQASAPPPWEPAYRRARPPKGLPAFRS